MMTEINNRYDFLFIFDVADGNRNGDPDAGNLPRIDPETGHGLVSDVCIKRKLRNYVLLSEECREGYDVFVKEKSVLNRTMLDTFEKMGMNLDEDPIDASDGQKRTKKGKAQGSEIDKGQAEMCRRFFDVRTFGAVMSTGPNAGQVRGPVQITFSRSVDPIVTLEHTITRMAVATEKEAEKQGGDNRTMGRKNTVPYGLYIGRGFISAALANQTGFCEEDLAVFWKAVKEMFEHDRSAARGLMSLRKLIVFRHASKLGNAPAHKLFETVSIARKEGVEVPRNFVDYEVSFDKGAVPAGIEVHDMV